MADSIEGYCLLQHARVLQCQVASLGATYYTQLSTGNKCADDTKEKLISAVSIFELAKCELLSFPSKFPTPVYAGVNPTNITILDNDTEWVSATSNGGWYLQQPVVTGDDSYMQFTVEFSSANGSTAVGLVLRDDLSTFSATGNKLNLDYSLVFDSAGNVDLYNNNTEFASNVTTYSTGDKFKLIIDDDLVLKIYKNGTLIYTWVTLDEDDVYYLAASFNNTGAFEVNDITFQFDAAPTSQRCELTGAEACNIIDHLYKLTS